MDFGGNEGELKKFCKAGYLAVNYDHSVMEDTHFDTIVCLAVIEHMEYDDVISTFHKFQNILDEKGRIFLTTPTRIAKPILEFLAFLRILERDNIAEHKHYWNRKDIYELAQRTGFAVRKYRKFQIGLNQLAVLIHI